MFFISDCLVVSLIICIFATEINKRTHPLAPPFMEGSINLWRKYILSDLFKRDKYDTKHYAYHHDDALNDSKRD